MLIHTIFDSCKEGIYFLSLAVLKNGKKLIATVSSYKQSDRAAEERIMEKSFKSLLPVVWSYKEFTCGRLDKTIITQDKSSGSSLS